MKCININYLKLQEYEINIFIRFICIMQRNSPDNNAINDVLCK